MRQDTIIHGLVSYQTLCLKGKHRCSFTWRQRPVDRAEQREITTKIRMTQLAVKRLEINGVCLTNQSSQGAVRDGGWETDNNEVLVVAKLLHFYALFRHHVQLLQGVGLLRVPDGTNHVWGDGRAVEIRNNNLTKTFKLDTLQQQTQDSESSSGLHTSKVENTYWCG